MSDLFPGRRALRALLTQKYKRYSGNGLAKGYLAPRECIFTDLRIYELIDLYGTPVRQ